jgi:hypothetical protein
VPRHYYDPNLHGVDWQAKVSEARNKIDKEKSVYIQSWLTPQKWRV